MEGKDIKELEGKEWKIKDPKSIWRILEQNVQVLGASDDPEYRKVILTEMKEVSFNLNCHKNHYQFHDVIFNNKGLELFIKILSDTRLDPTSIECQIMTVYLCDKLTFYGKGTRNRNFVQSGIIEQFFKMISRRTCPIIVKNSLFQIIEKLIECICEIEILKKNTVLTLSSFIESLTSVDVLTQNNLYRLSTVTSINILRLLSKSLLVKHYKQVKVIKPFLIKIPLLVSLFSKENETRILLKLCNYIYELSFWSTEKQETQTLSFSEHAFQILFQCEFSHVLIGLLEHISYDVKFYAISIIENIIYSDNSMQFGKQLLNDGLLQSLETILQHESNNLIKETIISKTCGIITNIVSYRFYANQVWNFGRIIPELIFLLDTSSNSNIKKEILWSFENITSFATYERIQRLVDQDFIQIVLSLLKKYIEEPIVLSSCVSLIRTLTIEKKCLSSSITYSSSSSSSSFSNDDNKTQVTNTVITLTPFQQIIFKETENLVFLKKLLSSSSNLYKNEIIPNRIEQLLAFFV